ncbi:tumor necrosis factor ligand superfamily member 13B isoform X2 [Siniperca chuatsi]|uniref:tumor necrosis factor ligand superfamily member 13B isoform X2 n=1 Tax=Siniperca chuatsi TaxID=119488 RepID=UPI001CE16F3B|nr:tumor necrosis factor ligand superfamily member 13B isoform X2 [Siniperca chuatsi]
MAALAGVKPGTGQRAGEGRLSWPVFLLTLAAVTSSSLSALSLYQLVALRAEVEGLKSEVCRRREEGREVKHGGQTENISSRRSSQEPLHQPGSQHAFTLIRRRRQVSGTETLVSQPCLQLLANNSRKTFRKGIPWQAGLRRGSALEADGDSMLVREEGFYFVYSQVYYMDSTFAMGHVVIRRKRNVVGDEPQYVILFRCIQNMNPVHPYNTCYTGGIVKLEVGDHLELLIPRSTANVSMDGDSTFLGAVKLA